MVCGTAVGFFRRELSAVIGCTLDCGGPDCLLFFPSSACYLGQPAVACVLVLEGSVTARDRSAMFVSGPKLQSVPSILAPCVAGGRC